MRVIAGEHGGRRLVAPRGTQTRPTSDRVREAIFSALGDLSGLMVLDLFAGSGALAIEALSRGARAAVVIEVAGPALRALRQNVARLELEGRVRVVALPIARAFTSVAPAAPFDLVLVDPPYAEVTRRAFTTTLEGYLPLLAAHARLVLEHAARDAAPDLQPLVVDRTRRYGDTAVTFYRAGYGPALVPG